MFFQIPFAFWERSAFGREGFVWLNLPKNAEVHAKFCDFNHIYFSKWLKTGLKLIRMSCLAASRGGRDA